MKPFGLNILILKSHRANVCLKRTNIDKGKVSNAENLSVI